MIGLAEELLYRPDGGGVPPGGGVSPGGGVPPMSVRTPPSPARTLPAAVRVPSPDLGAIT